jgi:hypothetical protein
MRRVFTGFLFLVFLSGAVTGLIAQASSTDLLESDLDSLFDEPGEGAENNSEGEEGGAIAGGNENSEPEPPAPVGLIKKEGMTFTANYSFTAGYSPGWSEAPWFWNSDSPEFSQLVAAKMKSSLSLNFQISPSFRVFQSLSFSFPGYDSDLFSGFDLSMGDFFCDYTLQDKVYFRIGKHNVNWGISRNYPYTNLPVRIPEGSGGGDAYAVKTDIPLGVGGFQLLVLARTGFFEDIRSPRAEEAAYGAKYNLALPAADTDFGIFYHKDMRLRAMVSVKATLWEKWETYGEGLVSLDQKSLDDPVFAGGVGFFNDFFGGKLTVNGEYFFNGERYTNYLQDEDDIFEEEIVPFIYGHNVALNLIGRPVKGSFRLFIRWLHNFSEGSGQIVPGFSLRPFENMSLNVAFPLALGGRNGTYYDKNADQLNRPFSAVIALTFSGSYKTGDGQSN